MLKLLLKFRNTYSQTVRNNTSISVFISVNPPSSRSVLVNVLELFPANSLGGAFFNKCYLKICEVKDFCMFWPGMHGESRFFPFGGISEAPSVCVGPLVGLLDCPSKVTVLCITYVTLPKINHVTWLTVQGSWSFDFHVVDFRRCVGSNQWAL